MVTASRLLTLALILHVLPSTAAEQQPSWSTSTGGQMTFAMPCASSWVTTTQQGYSNQTYRCQTGSDLYLAVWTDYLPSTRIGTVPEELKANRDNFINGVGATLLTNRDITFQGLPGLEFTANLKGTHLITSRVVIHGGRRPYMLASLTPLNQDRAATIERFFASMRMAQ